MEPSCQWDWDGDNDDGTLSLRLTGEDGTTLLACTDELPFWPACEALDGDVLREGRRPAPARVAELERRAAELLAKPNKTLPISFHSYLAGDDGPEGMIVGVDGTLRVSADGSLEFDFAHECREQVLVWFLREFSSIDHGLLRMLSQISPHCWSDFMRRVEQLTLLPLEQVGPGTPDHVRPKPLTFCGDTMTDRVFAKLVCQDSVFSYPQLLTFSRWTKDKFKKVMIDAKLAVRSERLYESWRTRRWTGQQLREHLLPWLRTNLPNDQRVVELLLAVDNPDDAD
jgi:hypothetical protein